MRIDDPVLREAYNAYMREYRKKRYHSDPEYKKKVLESNKRWIRNNKEKWCAYMKKRNKRLKEDKNATNNL